MAVCNTTLVKLKQPKVKSSVVAMGLSETKIVLVGAFEAIEATALFWFANAWMSAMREAIF
jgi:hypothetical protein